METNLKKKGVQDERKRGGSRLTFLIRTLLHRQPSALPLCLILLFLLIPVPLLIRRVRTALKLVVAAPLPRAREIRKRIPSNFERPVRVRALGDGACRRAT